MNPDEHFRAIIPLPDASLATASPGPARVLSEMMREARTVARQVPLFTIGKYEWCEPDYRQILIWAEALALKPEEVIRRLLDRSTLWRNDTEFDFKNYHGVKTRTPRWIATHFSDGKIRKLNIDLDLLPLADFRWVEGLEINYLRITADPLFTLPDSWSKHRNKALLEQDLPGLKGSMVGWYRGKFWTQSPNRPGIRIDLPKLRELYCNCLLLESLDLSAVPCLETLHCPWNRLTDLDLSSVPQLLELNCEHNLIKSIDLTGVSRLRVLKCGSNPFQTINLASVPYLEQFYCSLSKLNEIDIRPLQYLNSMWCPRGWYDDDRPSFPLITRRADQDFLLKEDETSDEQ